MTMTYTPLTPEERSKQSWIQKAYYWFWHDICKRPEPFTYTMRRSAKTHPLWWILTPIVVGGGFYLLVAHLWGIL